MARPRRTATERTAIAIEAARRDVAREAVRLLRAHAEAARPSSGLAADLLADAARRMARIEEEAEQRAERLRRETGL